MRSLLDCKRPLISITLLVVVAVFGSGCNSSGESDAEGDADGSGDKVARTAEGLPLRVAVIDVNEVARQIGAMDKIEQSLAKYESELNQQLTEFQRQLDQEYSEQRDEFGADLNQQQQQDLDSLLDRHQQNLVTQASLAQTRLHAEGDRLKLKLLVEVRPIAYEIAAKRGMSMVLTTAQVYAAPPDADITAEVIDRIREINTTAQNQSSEADSPQRTARLPGGGEFKPY